MALIVQDDAGSVEEANSYVDLAELKAFYADRGEDLSAHTDQELEAALVRATDFLDARYRFAGHKVTHDQSTAFPRVLEDRTWWESRTRTSGSSFPARFTGIPRAVKRACCLLAKRALAGALMPDPTRDPSGQVVQSTSKSVGPVTVSTTFAVSTGGRAEAAAPTFPEVDLLLRNAGLLASPGGTMVRA